jgi:hypothetical protein
VLVGLAAAFVGCQHDEIRTYEVAKTEMTRLLGAILPHGDSTWFFKLSGPASTVGAHEAEFTAFLRSLHFTDAGDRPLVWTLPQGWTLEKGSGQISYATILVGDKDGLKLTITKLGQEGQAGDVPANVNRWRNQLALSPVTEDELRKDLKELEVDVGTVTLVDLTGAGSGKTGTNAPFAAAGGGRMPPAAVKEQKSDIAYRAPEGWNVTRGNGISRASFEVRDGDKKADVTVTPLAGGAGGLEANVNRWRGQVGLAAASKEEVGKLAQPLRVDGRDGHYADLAGAARRILAVMVERDGTTWFVKMDGPVDLVGKQKANFEAFVRSLRFDGGPGGNDG